MRVQRVLCQPPLEGTLLSGLTLLGPRDTPTHAADSISKQHRHRQSRTLNSYPPTPKGA